MNTLAEPVRESAPARMGAEINCFERIDELIRECVTVPEILPAQFPALIDRGMLEKAEYPEAFPHLLLPVCGVASPDAANGELLRPENLGEPEWLLSPAVCYHAYAKLANRELARPLAIAARGRCFRNETEVLHPGRRQVEFEMREVVLLGHPGWIDGCLEALRRGVEAAAAQLGIAARWETATDPFFLPKAEGKAHLQRLLETKRELVLGEPGDPGLAIASINRHGTFFGDRFEITQAGGRPVETACVAFGLDRWVAAARNAGA